MSWVLGDLTALGTLYHEDKKHLHTRGKMYRNNQIRTAVGATKKDLGVIGIWVMVEVKPQPCHINI